MLTTEQVIEIVSKVTGLPHGLFREQALPRTRGGLTNFVFDCDAESDEYSVLVNVKDEIIEIKNAYNTWGQAIIKIQLNPPAPLPQRPDPSNNTMVTGAFTAQPLAPPKPAAMPPALGALAILNTKPLIQFVVDYLQLNPNSIGNSMGRIVNETCTYNTAAWTLLYMSALPGDDQYEFTFTPSACGDQAIADEYTITLYYEVTTGNIIDISES